MDSAANEIVLLGVGDIGPIHEPLEKYGELVKATLATGDIRFAQCEKVYSDRGSMQVHSGGIYSRQPAKMAAVFPDCGFNLVSMASNHAMDWGGDALLDTIALFDELGIKTVGAGANLAEARRPAIFEIRGVRVGMLAYCSALRDGYAAGPDTPGVAPMRAHTYYEPIEYQAGTPPKVITVPFEDDLAGMCEDIDLLRDSVDVVVLSHHWGVHHIPKLIADYQRIVAQAAFEHGADLILGGHAHIPKAVEMFDGKACFYSLSNFIFTSVDRPGHSGRRYGLSVDSGHPNFPFGMDGRRSLIAKARLSTNGVEQVSFLPVFIDDQLRPEVLASSDPRFADALAFMETASEDFPHTFKVDGDEVLVS